MLKSNYRVKLQGLFAEFKLKPEWVTLTQDQKDFADEFFNKQNIFLTGAAGSGKSYVSSLILDYSTYKGMSVGKTALTGVAAFNIGGQTLHSFFGLGLAEDDAQTLISKLIKFKKVRARISVLEILFIDEVSMLKASLLEKLDAILKYFRHSKEPFGGIKVLFCGDFCQLPPIFKGDETKNFCFKSSTWANSKIKTINLKQIVRQQDNEFVKILNDIRFGITDDLGLLESRIDAKFTNGIDPVRIFCKNVDIISYNNIRLAEIKSPIKTYISKDNGESHHIESFNKNCPAPQVLELKVGAQVMLLANLDTERGFVNGSIGVVQAYSTEGVVVKFKQGKMVVSEKDWHIKEQDVSIADKLVFKIKATRTQMPLKLAYATSVHKCQGMTLDCAIIDMNEAFDSGMVYSSLSRCRNLESISIVDFPKSKIRINKDCLDFYKNLEKTENDI